MQWSITPEGKSQAWFSELSISWLIGFQGRGLIRCRKKTLEIRMLGLCSSVDETSCVSVSSSLKQTMLWASCPIAFSYPVLLIPITATLHKSPASLGPSDGPHCSYDKAQLLRVACGSSSWIPARLSPTPPSPSRPHICPAASPAELLYLEPHPHLFLPSSSSPSDLTSVVISSGKHLLLFACMSVSLLFCLLSPVLLAIILLWLFVNYLKKWERFGIVLVYAVHCTSLRICDKVEHLLNEWRKGQMEGGIEREMEERLEGWCPDASDISPRRHLQSITNGSTSQMWSQVTMALFNT